MMEKAFYFILFVLEIFLFLSPDFFGCVGKRVDKKTMVN